MEISSDDDYYSWLILADAANEPHAYHIILAILAILVLLFLSAMVSGSEVAFFSLSRKEIDNIKEKTDKMSSLIIQLLESPKKLLATILIANNLFNVGVVVISYFVIMSFIDANAYPFLGFILEIIVVTLMLVLFGEVIPKTFANYNNRKIAYLTAFPLTILEKIFNPLSKLLVSSTNIIENRIKRDTNRNISAEDVNDAIDLSVGTQASKQEINILKGIVKFGDISVKQIMRARVDVIAIEHETSFKETLNIVRESGFSRIPVFQENEDSIKGILYVKDLLKYVSEKEDFKWQSLIRTPFFVPETKKIDDLLREFQTKRIHLAIVVDEYGGTSGIVTLEDVMEEIIGEITDEFDEAEEIKFDKIDDNNYIFEGKTLLNDIYKVVGIKSDSFDEVSGDFDSLAGLILELSGKIPKKNERVSYKDFLFTVLAVSRKRIVRVKLTYVQDDESA